MIAYPETNCKIVAFLRSYVLSNTFATGFFTRCFSIWLCSFQGTFRSLSIPENDTGSRRRTVNCQTLRLVFSHSHISVYRPEMKRSDFSSRFLPRKEVIQPHLPIRLPCYDFTPVTCPAFGSSLLAVESLTSGVADSHGVTGGVYKTRERIHRGILIRDY